jgi:hypothetical protein
MVDQADVKPTNGRDEGRSELPPRAVARSTGEFLHDVTTLAELQGKLLLVESKQGLTKLVMPIALLVLGVVIALGCVPIALAALAITLVQAAEFSLAAAMWISLAVGAALAAILTLAGYFWMRSGLWFLDRSYYEWQRNVAWAKDMMRRLSNISKPQAPPRSTYSTH